MTSRSFTSPGKAAVRSSEIFRSRGLRSCDQTRSPPPSTASKSRGGMSLRIPLLVLLFLVLDPRLESGLAAALELDGRVHLQRDAGEQLPHLAPQRLALEKAPHLVGDHPGHFAARLVGLGDQERERILGHVHVADKVADALLSHPQDTLSLEDEHRLVVAEVEMHGKCLLPRQELEPAQAETFSAGRCREPLAAECEPAALLHLLLTLHQRGLVQGFFPSCTRGFCPRGTAVMFAIATRSAMFWAMRVSACASGSPGSAATTG